MKENTLARELTSIACRQLITSYNFKLPRISQIRKYRDLYNGKAQRQLRIRYNIPIPIFSGMIDVMQADLDDSVIIKYQETDPADWKAVRKANAALQQELQSMRPGAQWDNKFRMARQECIMTGRGVLKYQASSNGGYTSNLSVVPFEDFYFEPKGGGDLESHLFCGEGNIWKTEKELTDEAGGIYDAAQVKSLVTYAGNDYKQSSIWDNYDYANRFQSLNLSSESNNYVGEKMYNLVEWILTYKGERWYLLFEAYTNTWIRFEKLDDIHSDGYFPWMSFASHKDIKNFASKGFADDLYPIAVTMTDFFNEDFENRKRRNSNARAYDKDMFPNVAQLDQAQMGRDRLVEADTKGGTRRISDGVYAFQTPEITGTLDMLGYLETMAGRNFGVTDLQIGDAQPASKTVGVTEIEMSQVSKRLSFEAQPFIQVGQELGLRFFGGLKDYLREPLSIKLLGENGYEWDTLRRIDLNVKKGFEISVISQSQESKMNQRAKKNRIDALQIVSKKIDNPSINARLHDEYVLRDIGDYSEAEIGLLLDPNTQADKTTIAETSAAIQEIMRGKVPPMNYNATAYFLQVILDFVKTHQDDPKVAKRYKEFLAYIQKHETIATENEARRAHKDAKAQNMTMAGAMPPNDMPSGDMPPIPNSSPIPIPIPIPPPINSPSAPPAPMAPPAPAAPPMATFTNA